MTNSQDLLDVQTTLIDATGLIVYFLLAHAVLF